MLHFLLAGAALVAVDLAVGGEEPPGADGDDLAARTIRLTDEFIRTTRERWREREGRAPTADELGLAIAEFVRQEALYREARARGLDQGDLIVRRRLIQKMEFITRDLVTVKEPTEAELAAHLDDNAERWAHPETVTFHHVFFSRQRRGSDVAADAARVLEGLDAKMTPDVAARLGDAFLREREYEHASAETIDRAFGPGFARAVLALEPGRWAGPIESSLGVHLVFVRAHRAARPATLDEVRSRVRSDLIERRRESATRDLERRIIERYPVIRPDG